MGPEQQPELGPTPQQQRQPEPEPEPEPRAEQAQAQGSEADAAEDGGSCKQRAVDGVEEYRRQLTVLPIWWCVLTLAAWRRCSRAKQVPYSIGVCLWAGAGR
jgi:hypothetical protein